MLYILLCLRYLLPNLILNGVHAAQNGKFVVCSIN